ncbi:MAG: hypothetical protein EXR50_06895 [Dehalococcoidia bacterium]|nr:hypothetical protein [Dehalococcoidia bacterium]
MAIRKLAHVTVIVWDQDEALDWYTRVLGFRKVDDRTDPTHEYRWLTVAPEGQEELEIVLHKAQNEREEGRIGRNAMWGFEADDCRKTFQELTERGVIFTSPPEELPWGIAAGFRDLYGNPFELVEPR